jgi:hypothetical protein
MSEDPRCCGTGTCIINAEGVCWCGQVWDGEKMCWQKVMKNDGVDEDNKTVDIGNE